MNLARCTHRAQILAPPRGFSPVIPPDRRPGTPAKALAAGVLANEQGPSDSIPATSSSCRPHSAPSSQSHPTWKAKGKAGQVILLKPDLLSTRPKTGTVSPRQYKIPTRPTSA